MTCKAKHERRIGGSRRGALLSAVLVGILALNRGAARSQTVKEAP